MRKFIRLSKYNGTGPATPIYVNVDQIKGIERTPGGGTPTATLWGIELADGQPLRVGESVEHVMAAINTKESL